MDKQEFKTKFPEIFAEAVADGVAAERDRVTAHLTLAKRSGEMAVALESITSGEGLTSAIMERHIDARLCKLETRERQIDSDEAGAILDGAAPAAEGGKDLGDIVADMVEAQSGKKTAAP